MTALEAALSGFGWEDLVVKFGLYPEEAKRLVLEAEQLRKMRRDGQAEKH